MPLALARFSQWYSVPYDVRIERGVSGTIQCVIVYGRILRSYNSKYYSTLLGNFDVYVGQKPWSITRGPTGQVHMLSHTCMSCAVMRPGPPSSWILLLTNRPPHTTPARARLLAPPVVRRCATHIGERRPVTSRARSSVMRQCSA